MKLSTDTAGICGLFCGTCPSFPDECGGCLSDHVAERCSDCRYGFRTCAAEHGVTRCCECSEMPCGRLEDFSKIHIVNGVHHHEHIVEDLAEMKTTGVRSWVDRQTASNACPVCGELFIWFEDTCRKCGAKRP